MILLQKNIGGNTKMATIPEDPVILLSYINTQLRDFYKNLHELCDSLQLDQDKLCTKLKAIDYEYNATTNQFV